MLAAKGTRGKNFQTRPLLVEDIKQNETCLRHDESKIVTLVWSLALLRRYPYVSRFTLRTDGNKLGWILNLVEAFSSRALWLLHMLE